jgi:hypothetical protein
MNLTLENAKQSTDEIFASDLVVPDFSPDWKRKLEAFKETHLDRHYRKTLFDARCEQAEEMGFVRLDSSEVVQMLMGESHTDTGRTGSRLSREWMYNHIDDTEKFGGKCKWGERPNFWDKREVQAGFLFSSTETKWRVQSGPVDYLNKDIPYGVALRMQEIKKMKFFNAFGAYAPEEAWIKQTDIDPIVVAEIWEFEYNGSKPSNSGREAYFFVAQW